MQMWLVLTEPQLRQQKVFHCGVRYCHYPSQEISPNGLPTSALHPQCHTLSPAAKPTSVPITLPPHFHLQVVCDGWLFQKVLHFSPGQCISLFLRLHHSISGLKQFQEPVADSATVTRPLVLQKDIFHIKESIQRQFIYQQDFSTMTFAVLQRKYSLILYFSFYCNMTNKGQ